MRTTRNINRSLTHFTCLSLGYVLNPFASGVCHTREQLILSDQLTCKNITSFNVGHMFFGLTLIPLDVFMFLIRMRLHYNRFKVIIYFVSRHLS